MSRWGLTYKGVEILSPDDWNTMVDALEDLSNRLTAGEAVFTGDGSTDWFKIAHGLGVKPIAVMVGKGASGLPDIDYWEVDETYITVHFKSPPSEGANVRIWWIAVKW